MIMRFMTPLIACAALVLVGCGTAEWDWSKTTATNTLAAYQTFVRQHPNDKRADDARGRILALQDELAWDAAQKANNIEGYRTYLQTDGGGSHAEQAQFEVTARERADAWKALQNDMSSESLQSFLQKYPQGAEAVLARQKLADFAYHLQLADARNQGAAERKRAQLQAKFGTVLHEVVVVAPQPPASEYRITSGPMSHATAESACATLERARQSCKLVQDAQQSAQQSG